MSNKVYITKKFSFEAAHHLPNYEGKCSNLHGHSYKLEVTVSGDIDLESIAVAMMRNDAIYASDGMVIDFSELKKCIKESVGMLDHANLNDYYTIPTAEYMAISIFKDIQSRLGNKVKLECVKLWETEDSYAEYRGE